MDESSLASTAEPVIVGRDDVCTPAGTVLAGYKIESLLGAGASGEVYLAGDFERGGRVALKVLAAELADDVRFRRRFLRESSIAATLDHPHAVSIVAAGESDGVLYLAMSYIEGIDLRELLRRERRLDPERAVLLLAQVAEALDAAHRAGLVHRDVKPANILIAEESAGERAVVCDFGLARHVSSAGSLTGDRGFVGTIDYIAPEQVEGSVTGVRADVYSLACVLFECLAGVRPFERETELSVVFAHLNEPPPRVSEAWPALPRALDGVFARGLAKRPDDRFATCAELMRATRAALRGRALPRPTSTRRTLVDRRSGVPRGRCHTRRPGSGQGDGAPGGDLAERDRRREARLVGLSAPDALGVGYRKSRLDYPRDYSMLMHNSRKVAAYFEPNNPRAVEITTWNPADKTAEGVGPCSSVDDLKRAFGSRLNPFGIEARSMDIRSARRCSSRSGSTATGFSPSRCTPTQSPRPATSL